ncbi:MAG: gephyrin-like molybdotransferase Glp [Paracoccaceae bacterium]
MKDRARDDCFALPPGTRWTPVDEALARLRDGVLPVTAFEEVPLAEAAGRFLALPAIAERDNPVVANAAVDGYALAHADAQPGAEGRAVLALAEGRAAAGLARPPALPRGRAMRILTGAAIPEGADTVVLQEDAEVAEGLVSLRLPKRAGANVRPAGEDAERGATLLPAGRRLTPADLARLAVAGVGTVAVHEQLRVGVLSTGSELVQPGADPDGPGTFDANRPMLLAAMRAMGFEAVDLGAVADDEAAVRAALDDGAARADAILTTGGASAGDEDHVSRLLSAEGALSVWRIAVKPGRPLAFGRWRGAVMMGLPGNPVAAYVCALVFARPALVALAGGDWPEPVGYPLPAAFAMTKKPGRREFLRARLAPDGRVERYHSEGSGLTGGLSWADGLVELPDEEITLAEGDPVRFLPWSSFGIA